jgi:CRP-like cAMP-binding protein
VPLSLLWSEYPTGLNRPLENIKFLPGDSLFDRFAGKPAILFPVTLVASQYVRMSDGAMTGVATVGREGILGLMSIMHPGHQDLPALACSGGTADVISGAELAAVLDKAPSFGSLMLRCATLLASQLGQVAACNRLHDARSRLASWLLLMDDRLESPGLGITHEMMATVLGLRRPSVTLAAAELQKDSCIQYSRGHVQVLDRARLYQRACECYPPMRANLRAVLGPAG